MTGTFGPVYTMVNRYPGMYRMPKPKSAPRVPAYFPRMKVRGKKRRQKWEWELSFDDFTAHLRAAVRAEQEVQR